MSNRTKFYVLYAVGMIFCIIPSVLAVASYFPVWKEAHPSVLASGVMVSVFSISLMACVALPPIAKWMKGIIGKTPSAWVGFAIAALVFKMISAVIDALFVIFFIASLSNLCGQVFFFMANRVKKASEDE